MKLSQSIFKNNETHKHIKIDWTLILKILAHLKKINKVNTIKWRPIYEVIDEAYSIGSKFSQMIYARMQV